MSGKYFDVLLLYLLLLDPHTFTGLLSLDAPRLCLYGESGGILEMDEVVPPFLE